MTNKSFNFSAIRLISIILFCFVSSSNLYSYTCKVEGVCYYLNYSKKTATVTYDTEFRSGWECGSQVWKDWPKYGTYKGNIVIPDSIEYNSEKFAVTSIGMKAFYQCKSLVGITLPNTINEIGSEAFYICSSLREIIIPDSVTYLPERCFEDCTSLSRVVLPETFLDLGNSAFAGCRNLSEINLPESMTNIGAGAFEGCKSLTKIVIPRNIITIEEYTFEDCSSLTDITLHDGITTIGKYAFSGCSNLKTIQLPSKITTIEVGLFSGCTRLENMHIPIDVTKIGDNAFSRCESLESIDVPNGITELASYVFEDCSSLKKVVIGENIEEINKYAFEGCSNFQLYIKSRNIPKLSSTLLASEVITPVGCACTYARAEYWKDVDKIYSTDANGNKLIPLLINTTGKNIISINGSCSDMEIREQSVVTILSNSSFRESYVVLCDGQDVTNIIKTNGAYSFAISESHKNNIIKTVGQDLFTVEMPEAGRLLELVGIENIGNLYAIKINGNINGTDILAIRKMDNLQILDLGDANIVDGGLSYYNNYVTSKDEIGNYFFTERTNLYRVILPKGVTKLGTSAFSGMTNLCSISIPNNEATEIGAYCFDNCSSLQSVIIEDGKTPVSFSNPNRTFSGCPIRYLYLGRNADAQFGDWRYDNNFSWSNYKYVNTHLKSLVIGDLVTKINKKEFENFIALESVDIGTGIKEIGDEAFSNCRKINRVNIKDLKVWNNISFVNYNSNPTAYSKSLYLNGVEITSLDITKSVKDYTFYNCKNITNITFNNNVTSIGKNSFEGCI